MKKLYSFTISVIFFLSFFDSGRILAQAITVSGMPETLCAGESFTLDYSASGFTANSGNKFIAELSDASGSFSSPVNIGEELTTVLTGTINAIIPENTVLGSGYRIRVNSTDEAVTGTDNGTDINIDCSVREYYWVGGSGNWSDNTAHWSKYPDQFKFHDSPPGNLDNVYFSTLSFTSGGTLTIDIPAECNNMLWMPGSGSNKPQIIGDANNSLTIYGDFTLDNGVQRAIQDLVFDAAPVVTQNISFADNLFANSNITFRGGGTWIAQSDIAADSISLRTGTFNSNNNQLDVDALFFYEDQISNWGTSVVNISRGMYNNSSTLTFDRGTSSFNFSSNLSMDLAGPFTLYDVVLAGSIKVSGNNTFNNLTFMAGSTISLATGSTQTISGGTLTATGFRHLPIKIKSSLDGIIASISQASGTIDTEYLILQDNNAIGGATFNTTNYIISGIPGNVTGWNLGAPIVSDDFFWTGDGGNWSDFANHWAQKSNGTEPHTFAPGPADNVFFNIGSFSQTGQIVILNNPVEVNDMIWVNQSGAEGASISGSTFNSLTIHGELEFDDDVKRDIIQIIFDSPNSGNTIDFANNQGGINNNVITMKGGGSWNLASAMIAKSVNMQAGTLSTNDMDVSMFELAFLPSASIAAANLSGSIVYLNSLQDNSLGLATLDAGTSTIWVTQSKGNFNANFSLNDIQVIDGAIFTVTSDLSVNNLTLDPGSTLIINQAKTLTTSTFSAIGTPAKPIRIQSDSRSNEGYISQSSGTVDTEFLHLLDNHALGGATFNAINSINFGNTIGWNITAPPTLMYYWVGGSGNWSDATHWALTDGGTVFYPFAPGASDNVYFTPLSFTLDDETVVIDQDALCNNMTWTTTKSQAPTLFGSADVSLKVFGSFTLADSVQRNIARLIFASNNTGNIINMADNIYGAFNEIEFVGTDIGAWILSSDFKTHSVNFRSGILNTGDFNIETNVWSFTEAEAIDFTAGSSIIQTSEFNNFTTNSNLVLNPGTSTLQIVESQQDSNQITGPFNLYDVIIASNATINGANSFNSFTVNPGIILTLEANKVQSMNLLTLNGLSDAGINIESTQNGAQGTFSVPVLGTVSADYVIIKDNNATGGASFTATNSAGISNVTGWFGILIGQTISFPLLDDILLTETIALNATASSGLPVNYTIDAISGGGSESGGIFTPASTGLVGITASQGGDTAYGPAQPITRYVHISVGDAPNELGRMKQASYVVGVPNGVTPGSGALTSKSLPKVTQAIVSPSGKLIAAGKARVMIWNELPDAYDIPANVVVGQADFTSLNLTPSRTIMGLPAGNFSGSVAVGPNGQLIVSDGRGVLIWDTIPAVNGAPADIILGQTDFSSTTMGVAAHKFKSPFGVAVSNDGKLIVSDVAAHRVLIFDQFPIQNGDTADWVIGQPDFTTSTPGLSNQDLSFPGLVSVTRDNKLLIADINNNRIMVYNSVPAENYKVADAVIGQPDFNSKDTGTAIDLLSFPAAAAVSRTGKLAIADVGNSRVLIYDQVPANNTILPDTVLGQPGYDTKGLNNSLVSLRSMAEPLSITWDVSENLLITDSRLERVMVYGAVDNEPPVITATTPLSRYSNPGDNNKVVISTNDRSGIDSANAYYQKVTTFNPASPNYLKVALTDLGNGDYEFDLDPINPTLGIEYYFELSDSRANIATEPKVVIPVYYPDGIPINSYGVGNTKEDYKIMSVPLVLDNADVVDVFSNIYSGTYDNTKMRVFSFDGNGAKYNEYNAGFTDFEGGKGYYALSTTNGNVISTAGETSFESNPDGTGKNIHEYKIDLIQGWNLIGNPFLNDVVWADIVSLSGINNGEVDPPQGYNGNYSPLSSIPFGTGAFVHNSTLTTFTLRIPAKINTGGRFSSLEENNNPLTESSWEVRFKAFGNNNEQIVLGAIGMEEEADYSKDKFDRLNPPVFGNMKVIEFEHAEYFTPSFKKDIREAAVEEKWSFAYKVIETENTIHELHWDNSYFGADAPGANTPDLYLVDKTHFVTINMKEDSSYTFNHAGNTRFEVFFGDNAWQNLLPGQLETQTPYPNPFSREVKFNVGLPITANKYIISVNIYNTLGKRVAIINSATLEAGYYTLNWSGINHAGQEVPDGIYAYRMVISGEVNRIVTGKIIKQ